MGTLADYFKARKELKKHKEEINRYNKAWSKVRKEQAEKDKDKDGQSRC